MRLHHRVPETVAFIIIVLHMTDRSLILTVNFHQKCNWWGEGRIISPFKVTWQKWGPLRASELSFRIWGAELQTPWGGVGICFIILFLALVDKALLVRAGRG